MSSTSDQTTQPSKKTRLIIDEIGVDTETGIIGKGHSYDNGKTFTVDDTIYGRIYHADDHGKIWKGIQDQVAKVVEPAKSAANSAVAYANDAIEKSRVNSQAMDDINSAVTEAKQGANDAMSRAKSAWDVATGAKEAVTDFDPLLKSAQSDAGKALTQIADTASALSDAKAAFTSDVAVAKNLASTAQTTADSAVKSASSVANDLTAVANQAKANADGITKVTSDVGLLKTTVADNSGNISTIQETAKQIQQAVSDNAGNITVAKQTAGSAVAVASDAKSNATVAVQTASQASITANNASGQAASAVLTANGAMTTASDAKSDATVAVQTASGASLTAINANSDATVAKQTASEAKIQASNAESDFAQISIRANKIEANVANNSGAIASVQQTANGLTTTVADIISNGGGRNLAIGTDQEYAMGYGIPNTTWQDGYAYEKLPTTVINGEILPQDPHSFAYTMTQGTTYTQTVWFETDATVKNLSAAQITWFAIGLGHDWQPAIIQKLGQNSYKIVSTYTWPGKTSNYVRLFDIGALNSAFDLSTGTYLKFGKLMLENGTVSHDWSPAPEDAQNQFTQIKQSIDGVTTTINDPKTGLNATYQTAAGNATTISNVKSDVYQLQTTANGLTSRVGNLESKTNTQETAIEQNKNAIALKADQTAVDKINGTVSQLQSSLTVQAGQIQEKVTSSQVTGMLAGYATQDYTQSLVTQKANDWNLNLTSLKTDVNAIKTNGGGVNLLQGTRDFSGSNWLKLGTIWTKTDETYNGLSVVETTDDWNGIAQYYQVKQGETYIFSLFARYTSGTGTSNFYIGLNSDPENGYKNAQVDNRSLTCSLDTNWKKYSITFTAKADGYIKPRMERTKANTNPLRVCGFMLEKGTVAHDWSPAPSDMATVTSVTNLSATVDGIQAQVYNSDGTSKITQLSNLIATKVSSGDYNSQITQLKNDINLRVTKDDVISQINQEAGGNTLIQVSNGKGSLILNADNTIMTGKAWIPDAAISSISADKIMLGSTSLWNTDGTLNLVNKNDGTTSKITVTQGNVNFDGVNKNASIIKFASDNNTNAFTVNPTGATVTPTLFFERFDQTVGHWLGFTRNGVEHEGVTFHTWDDEAERFFISCHARFDKNLRTLGTLSQGSWDGTNGKPEAGVLTIKSGNTIWSGSDFLAVGSNVTGTYTGVLAKAFVQQSTLSSKTNIEEVDPKDALDLVNKTDIRSYQYKSDVEQGKTKRYTSLIIDDVHDVSQYCAPDEFTSEERNGRDDGSAVGYLFLAVKELTRRIKTLEEKLNG